MGRVFFFFTQKTPTGLILFKEISLGHLQRSRPMFVFEDVSLKEEQLGWSMLRTWEGAQGGCN